MYKMPRPRIVKEYDIRVTPPLGQELTFITDEFDLFIACKEYGPINKKLHYHIYCKTTLNATEIKSYLRLICDVAHTTGNSLYRVKDAHAGTIGYMIKEFDVVASKGYTEDQLSEFKRLSSEYRKKIETERKAKQRERNGNAYATCETIVEQLKSKYAILHPITQIISSWSVSEKELAALILQKILLHYRTEEDGLAPPRSTVERMIITCLLKMRCFASVNEYYLPRCLQNII